MLREAGEESARLRTEATERSRELIKGARQAAGMVSADGQDIVQNLRDLGDSMRSNATRLLRDVQVIHSALLAQIDRVDPDGEFAEAVGREVTPADPGLDLRSRAQREADDRRAAERRDSDRRSDSRRAEERRRGSRREPGDDGLDIPEFIPGGGRF
jgi:hypothetical protein